MLYMFVHVHVYAAMRVSYLVLSLESSTLYVVSSSTTVVLVVVLVPTSR